MDKDIFKERGRGKEEAYFRQQDAKLIERLHQEAKLEEIARALAEKLQVDNPESPAPGSGTRGDRRLGPGVLPGASGTGRLGRGHGQRAGA